MPKVTKLKSRRSKSETDEQADESLPLVDNSPEQLEDADDGNDETSMPATPPMEDDKDDAKEEEEEEKMAVVVTAKEIAPEDTPAKKSPPKAAPKHNLLAPPASLANDFRGGQESWNAMLYQLLLYKAQRGDLNIPHNDTSYRLLHNWVQTQRKHYKLYQENKTSSTFLNADRIAVLDAIDFQWNVRGDSFWQKNFDALIHYKNEHGDVRVPRLYNKNPKLGEWVTDQRRQWKAKSEGKPNMMTDERKNKLDELGFVWKVRDRADWNDRYEQLLEFKKENGHCVVPQHYTRNRALGKWVAKQREQYRFYREGKHSFLTEERIDLLKSVGFVWQIKGRGANKKVPGKSKAVLPLNTEVKEKSLVKLEAEEKIKAEQHEMASAMDISDSLKGPLDVPKVEDSVLPNLGSAAAVAAATGTGSSAAASGGGKLPSLPPISQQQLLQANMAAIAAHASSNQNMVADLAAALRLGGAPSNAVPGSMNDPRAVAALRASQMGGDDQNSGRSFTSMI